jgi:hypothetical protein
MSQTGLMQRSREPSVCWLPGERDNRMVRVVTWSKVMSEFSGHTATRCLEASCRFVGFRQVSDCNESTREASC